MADLRLVAGLGNPGTQYADTRHNVGFMVVDAFATTERIDLATSTRWGCELGKWGDILLAKPLTYMNRSGQAIAALTRYFKIAPEEVLVVVDDVAFGLWLTISEKCFSVSGLALEPRQGLRKWSITCWARSLRKKKKSQEKRSNDRSWRSSM